MARMYVRIRVPETIWNVATIEIDGAASEDEAKMRALEHVSTQDIDWEDDCTGNGIDISDPRTQLEIVPVEEVFPNGVDDNGHPLEFITRVGEEKPVFPTRSNVPDDSPERPGMSYAEYLSKCPYPGDWK